MTCKKNENVKDCTCSSKDCVRHGVCCECVRKHRKANCLPHCLREIAQRYQFKLILLVLAGFSISDYLVEYI